MKDSPSSTPAWQKWLLRILGALFILGAIGYLALHGLAIWAVVKAFYTSGFRLTAAPSGQTLGQVVGQLFAVALSVLFGFWLIGLSRKKQPKTAEAGDASPGAALSVGSAPTKRSARAASRRWSLCNVLHLRADSGRVWQFDAGGKEFRLNREHAAQPGEALPPALVGKSWSSLYQPRLNVAWLPPEHVFIRVAQFPLSSPEETRAMVDLQLEKLSPIPVTQAVWTMQVLPHSTDNMQTIVVTIVPRSAVEEFLGRLEGQSYLADRLEVPMLDQLEATEVRGNGAWIYPEARGGGNSALVAWWYGGVLQNVDFVTLSADANRAVGLKDQLIQMAWAGELEGWLTSPPAWHLVADEATAKAWEPPLREGLDQPIEVIEPVSGAELASRTARRAARSDPNNNLLPAEFAVRYRQQFVDRLWMRGLGAVLALYVVGLIVYFIAVAFLGMQTRKEEQKVMANSLSYTNALRTRDLYAVLKERQDLKFAALDCWEAVAETIPEGLTLDSLIFSDGRRVLLSGTGPPGDFASINNFYGEIRKKKDRMNQPLFDVFADEDPLQQRVVGGAVRWSFGLRLERGEEP